MLWCSLKKTTRIIYEKSKTFWSFMKERNLLILYEIHPSGLLLEKHFWFSIRENYVLFLERRLFGLRWNKIFYLFCKKTSWTSIKRIFMSTPGHLWKNTFCSSLRVDFLAFNEKKQTFRTSNKKEEDDLLVLFKTFL